MLLLYLTGYFALLPLLMVYAVPPDIAFWDSSIAWPERQTMQNLSLGV